MQGKGGLSRPSFGSIQAEEEEVIESLGLTLRLSRFGAIRPLKRCFSLRVLVSFWYIPKKVSFKPCL